MRFKPAIFLALAVSVPTFAGGIYKYVEKDGTIVYTNVPPKGAQARQARKVEGDFRPAPSIEQPSRITQYTRRSLGDFDALIDEAAVRYKMPPALVRAVMHTESAFDPNALSQVGASGLMQLMPMTARDMYVKDIFDPKENIEGGVRYLRVLANEFEPTPVAFLPGGGAEQDPEDWWRALAVASRRLIYGEVLSGVGFVTLCFLCLFFFFDFVSERINQAHEFRIRLGTFGGQRDRDRDDEAERPCDDGEPEVLRHA